MDAKAQASDKVGSGIASGSGMENVIRAPFMMADMECIGADGVAKWRARIPHNVVATGGKAQLINLAFNGAASSAWRLGLCSSNVGGGSAPNVTDVLSNHSWTECGVYGNDRQLVTFTTVGPTVQSVSQSAAFAFTGNASVGGAFVCNVQSTNGNTGVLYSAGTFAATRAVVNADTLNVTVTLSFA